MARYTVQRARGGDKLYGSTHASDECGLTYCGKEINFKWWILSNDGTGEVTCKTCIGIEKNRRGSSVGRAPD